MAEYEASRVLPADPRTVLDVVADPVRLPRWLPSVTDARITGPEEVRLSGVTGAGEYADTGFFRAQPDQLRVEWGSASRGGEPATYAGWLQIADRTSRDDGSSCEVTVHLSFFDERTSARGEDAGLAEALAELEREVLR